MGLLLEPIRHLENPKFGGVIFRRTTPQIIREGGLWDEAHNFYIPLGARPRTRPYEMHFPSGMQVAFHHLQHEKTKLDWQGAQLPYVGWDELTHFTQTQFFYFLSRNRSGSGVAGYIRATCNPDPDSFVRKLVDWWIDPKTGYAIPERAGVIRYFIRVDDKLVWAATKKELIEKYPEDGPFAKSFTFIPALLKDNPILMQKDPAYQANLRALSLVDRERLEKGNWNIRPAAGNVFKREWFRIVETVPADARPVRFWDLAATEAKEGKDPDYTVGLKLSRDPRGIFYVEHVMRFREEPHNVERNIKNTASQDGQQIPIGLWRDPAQAGKAQAAYYVKMLVGYATWPFPQTKDKVTLANPVSAQAGAGNIRIVRGEWNEDFLTELENFPGKGHDDQVDALSGAFHMLIGAIRPEPRITQL